MFETFEALNLNDCVEAYMSTGRGGWLKGFPLKNFKRGSSPKNFAGAAGKKFFTVIFAKMFGKIAKF
jgi:hypothetical protein